MCVLKNLIILCKSWLRQTKKKILIYKVWKSHKFTWNAITRYFVRKNRWHFFILFIPCRCVTWNNIKLFLLRQKKSFKSFSFFFFLFLCFLFTDGFYFHLSHKNCIILYVRLPYQLNCHTFYIIVLQYWNHSAF